MATATALVSSEKQWRATAWPEVDRNCGPSPGFQGVWDQDFGTQFWGSQVGCDTTRPHAPFLNMGVEWCLNIYLLM